MEVRRVLHLWCEASPLSTGASWRARLQKRQDELPKKADEAAKPAVSAPPPLAVPQKYQVSGGVTMQRPGEQGPAEPAAARSASAEHGARDEAKESGSATKERAVVPTIAEAQKSEYADLDANHITALAIKARLLGGTSYLPLPLVAD